MNEQKPIIVAVDDQPAILHTVASELSELYQIRPFSSGQTALKYLENHPADLILLDYDMPGMNGCEILERLRADERMTGIPVIFLTGSTHGDTEVELLEKGASDYIQKPIKTRVLQTRVHIQLELIRYRNHMETLVEEKTRKMRNREDIALNLLARATDMRDHDTGDHIKRTTGIIRTIVMDLMDNPVTGYTLTPQEGEDIIKSSKLHDLGKIAIPDKILLKPNRLNEDEFELIKQHPLYGAELLGEYNPQTGDDSFLDTAIDIALNHHEKWNGEGYPNGLSGEEIPLSARITALADVYDALTSARPYKDPYSHKEALGIIASCSGTHFDPYLADLFIKHEKKFDKIVKTVMKVQTEVGA